MNKPASIKRDVPRYCVELRCGNGLWIVTEFLSRSDASDLAAQLVFHNVQARVVCIRVTSEILGAA